MSCARSSTSSRVTGTSALDQPLAFAGLRSLGILGGTFNPPHLGHLAVARHARDQLGLERLLLMPAGTPPHKPGGHGGWDPGPQHRLRMCQLLVEGSHRLSACPLEIERGGPSYTVDTLNAIHASHPDARLTFIVGADIASTLASWRQPRELLGLAQLAVAGRSGSDRRQVSEAVAGLGSENVSFLEMAPVEASSSMARLCAARGEPIEEIVGPAVARYIAEHRLYQRETR